MNRTASVRGQAVVATVVLSAAAALLVVLGVRQGFPAQRPRMASGAAWLYSRAVGRLTLLDGTSVEISAQADGVASPGSAATVTQRGDTAYVVDHTTGAVRRVDGATLRTTAPAVPIGGAGSALRLLARPGTLYALDTGHGELIRADPRTLAVRGRVPLGAGAGRRGAVLDGAGRLWVLAGTGSVDRITGTGRRTVPAGAAPGAGVLLRAGDDPVLVDTARGTAAWLDPASGRADRTVRFGPRAGALRAVGGSADGRLYAVTSGGRLLRCGPAGGCRTEAAVGEPGDAFGTPVAAGGHAFVPDYSTGRVAVVDVARARRVAAPRVLARGTRFELLAHDGIVFYNDPDSDRAGVVRPDGSFTPVRKYAPVSGAPVPPSLTATATRTGSPGPATRSPGTGGTASGPRPGPTGTGGSPTGTSGPPTRTPSAVRIESSASPAAPGETVTLTVVAAGGPAPVGARWDFGDGRSGTGTRARHAWQEDGVYRIGVTARFANGASAVAAVSLKVADPGGEYHYTYVLDQGWSINLGSHAPDHNKTTGTWPDENNFSWNGKRDNGDDDLSIRGAPDNVTILAPGLPATHAACRASPLGNGWPATGGLRPGVRFCLYPGGFDALVTVLADTAVPGGTGGRLTIDVRVWE